jgi:hypothetical protein
MISTTSAHPLWNSIPDLHLYNTTLCYKDIELGKTSSEDTKRILDSVSGLTWSPISPAANILNGPVRSVLPVSSPNGFTQGIDLFFRESTFQVGDLITYVGIPCAIYPTITNSRYPYTIILGYSSMSVWIHTDNWVVTPFSPVLEIDLKIPLPLNTVTAEGQVSPCRGADNAIKYKWHGFHSYPYR